LYHFPGELTISLKTGIKTEAVRLTGILKIQLDVLFTDLGSGNITETCVTSIKNQLKILLLKTKLSISGVDTNSFDANTSRLQNEAHYGCRSGLFYPRTAHHHPDVKYPELSIQIFVQFRSTNLIGDLDSMTKKRVFIIVPLAIVIGLMGIYFLFPGVMVSLALKAERSAGGFEQRSIVVEGLRIEYLEGGKGEVLLLLHGFGANKDNWPRIGKYFTPHFRVIAPDLTGFGESGPAPDGDYTISAQAERVKAFLQALGIKSLHLGGSSMGGTIAGAYASKYPSDLKSLLLIAPGGINAAEPSEMDRRLKKGKPNPLIATSVDDYEQLLDFVFVEKPYIPLPIKKALNQEAIRHQPLNNKIFIQLNKSFDVHPLEALLNGSLVTTLIVWGSQDRVLHVSGAKILETVMSKVDVTIMDAVGHLPMIEKPEETANLYLSFLKSKKLGLQ